MVGTNHSEPTADALQDVAPFQPPWFAHRNPQLPAVYTYVGNKGIHPQRIFPVRSGVPVRVDGLSGTTYIIFVDPSARGKKREREREVPGIPLGREAGMRDEHGASNT